MNKTQLQQAYDHLKDQANPMPPELTAKGISRERALSMYVLLLWVERVQQ